MAERPPMLEVVIDGCDGAAKTPILNATRAALEGLGLRVAVCAPFERVNQRRRARLAECLGIEPNPRQALRADVYYSLRDVLDGAPLAIASLRAAIAEGRRQARQAGAHVLLFDRHWLTVFGEIGAWPFLAGLWGTDFPPTVALLAPPAMTRSSERFCAEVPWTASDALLEQTRHDLAALCAAHPQRMLATFEVVSRTQPLEPIVAELLAHIRQLGETR